MSPDVVETLRELARRCDELAQACADDSVRSALAEAATELAQQADALQTTCAPPLAPEFGPGTGFVGVTATDQTG